MKLIKTYEEFIYKDEEVQVEEPETKDNLVDRPVDTSVLSKEKEDKESYIDKSGIAHIKNWKVY